MGLFGFGNKNNKRIKDYEVKKAENRCKEEDKSSGVINNLRIFPTLYLDDEYNGDYGTTRVRIPRDVMTNIDIFEGDTVLILGKRTTIAVCYPLEDYDDLPTKHNKRVIRMDGICKNNLGLKDGNYVAVKKIKVAPAEKILLAPLEKTPPIDERHIEEHLDRRCVMVNGDNIVIPWFGTWTTYQVIDTVPIIKDEDFEIQSYPKWLVKGAVIGTEKTIVNIVEKNSKETQQDKITDYQSELDKIEKMNKIYKNFVTIRTDRLECNICGDLIENRSIAKLRQLIKDGGWREFEIFANYNFVTDDDMKPFLEHIDTHLPKR
jgi:hypothetical protein